MKCAKICPKVISGYLSRVKQYVEPWLPTQQFTTPMRVEGFGSLTLCSHSPSPDLWLVSLSGLLYDLNRNYYTHVNLAALSMWVGQHYFQVYIDRKYILAIYIRTVIWSISEQKQSKHPAFLFSVRMSKQYLLLGQSTGGCSAPSFPEGGRRYPTSFFSFPEDACLPCCSWVSSSTAR